MNVWALFWAADLLLLLSLPAYFARRALEGRAPLPDARVITPDERR